jgi:spermidine synthase
MEARNRRLFILAIIIVGMGGIVAQTILLRELLIIFSGSELSIGVIISSWVIWEAAGAYGAGRRQGNLEANLRAFLYCILLFSVFFPLSIYGIRVSKLVLGLTPEVGVGLGPILYMSLSILLPTAFLHGYLFTLMCSVWSQMNGENEQSGGRIYFLEMVGTIIGGVAVSYLLIPYYQSFQISLVIALAGGLVAAALGLSFHSLRKLLPFSLSAALVILSAVLLITQGADIIHRYTINKQWQGKNVVLYDNSYYQNIVVEQNEGQYTFFSDGIPFMTTPIPDIAFVEEFVHIPLLAHQRPQQVLVLGGGVGGVINEVLKYRTVKGIDYVEMDPLVLKAAKKFSTPLTDKEINSPLVHTHFIDGRIFLKRSRRMFDVILLGLPPPRTLQQNRFFTKEFFEVAKEALRKDGILVLTITGSLSYYSTELKEVNLSILSTAKSIFPHSFVIPGDVNIFLFSGSDEIARASSALLAERLAARSVETRLVNRTHLDYRLDAQRVDWFYSVLGKEEVSLNLDLSPKGLFYSNAYQTLLFSPYLKTVFDAANAIKPLWAALFIAALFLALFGIRMKYRGITIPCVIGTTGFAAMMIELALLFTFQVVYGYVFYEIGILLTAFMGGLAAGSLAASGSRARSLNAGLLLRISDICLVILSLSLYGALTFVDFRSISGSSLIHPAFLLLLFISGILPGAQFPLAITAAGKGVEGTGAIPGTTLERNVGLIYSVDLLGGWFGGMIGGLFLLPVLGLPMSCLLLALLKTGSSILLFTSPRK